ncbi:piggyBac transposable element-derived protein 4-like [Acyrthosiphon pisum]|uniref:PiggyBac transposable element-derived protein domain-containing protein n=1 Tax=Acyrthosiphon pisum TaxID=7029 RepID=A0A8R2F6R6_ACYPI|nr:piggyBac transposable element-derived protein 4-like [Acyrthosiphon pisum]|eukprot:XP_008181183.1 PREDICTED: piggyBac transposable element-derived protein 4-like [Acyrthosiphon pisum]
MKKDNKYASGDIEYAQCDDISAMRWKDRGSKPVTLISNMHNAAEHCVVLRRNSRGEKVPVSCPTGISDYNKYMGGVDKFDQYIAAYTISQKSRRWWIKLFYYFIDTAIVNSYILYILYKESCNKAKNKYVSQLDYRSMLTDTLVNNFSCRKKLLYLHKKKVQKKKLNNLLLNMYQSIYNHIDVVSCVV